MLVHLALFISIGILTGFPINFPINHLTILSFVAIAGGLYFFFVGFHLLARKRLLLSTPTSRIRSAALGLVEVNGAASGPHTMPAPITGKPCFLYHTTAWLHREKDSWEKVADETLHLPFFVVDSNPTSTIGLGLNQQDSNGQNASDQLLVEPFGAELDLHPDFREEFSPALFSSTSNDFPPRVAAFLLRHSIVPTRRLRIEERCVKPEDALFIAGTLTENPGVQVHPLAMPSKRSDSSDQRPVPSNVKPQIIRLDDGKAPTSTREMTQQAKIAAALNRAGITRPEAWSAAGVSYPSLAIEENVPPFTSNASRKTEDQKTEDRKSEDQKTEVRIPADRSFSSGFNLAPPVVLMKGSNNSTFVISFRSQKEFFSALAWKSAGMIWGGAAIILLGVYVLLEQMSLL